MSISKKLREELEAAEAALVKVSKELLSLQGTHKYSVERNAEMTREIEQVHVFLDALPTPPAKYPDGQSYNPYPLMTRLAVWMARKA